MRDGRFRDDLYYRIHVVPMEVPPLRARLDDVPVLVQHFLERFSRRFRRPLPVVSAGAMSVLQRHPWPGNVRELQNLVERLVAMHESTVIEEEDLPYDSPRLVAAAVDGQRAGQSGHHVRA